MHRKSYSGMFLAWLAYNWILFSSTFFLSQSDDDPFFSRWLYNIFPPLFFSFAVVQVLQQMANKIETALKSMELIRKEALKTADDPKPTNQECVNEEDNKDEISNIKTHKIKTN